MNLHPAPDLQQPVPLVVGTVHTMEGLDAAPLLPPGAVDIIELRADLLQNHPTAALLEKLRSVPFPVLLTVRCPSEGGRAPESLPQREALILRLLDSVAMLDVELANADGMQGVVTSAEERGVPIILSFHNFSRTPSIVDLEKIVTAAAARGAALCKIATNTASIRDVITLLELLDHIPAPIPVAAMGMGRFGKISRPLLAQAGSRLNYGWIHRPLVSGQWPAAELKTFLGNLDQ